MKAKIHPSYPSLLDSHFRGNDRGRGAQQYTTPFIENYSISYITILFTFWVTITYKFLCFSAISPANLIKEL